MTEAELKKEAIQYAVNYPDHYGKRYKHKDLRIAYIAGAKPREKQIQIDAKQIRALQKQNGELTDKVKKLEQKLIEADNATDVFNAQEKRIEELEYQLTHRNCLDCSNHSSKLRMRNLDLEKENAELRKDKKELCHSISEGGKACVYLNEQLTKAKELLKKFLSAYTSYADSFDDRDNEIVAEAEQFLKSEVEK